MQNGRWIGLQDGIVIYVYNSRTIAEQALLASRGNYGFSISPITERQNSKYASYPCGPVNDSH